MQSLWSTSLSRALGRRHRRAGRAAEAFVASLGQVAYVSTGFTSDQFCVICLLSGELSSRELGERSDRHSRSHECARQRARRRNARPVSNFVMLLRVTALAAAAAAAASAPPFVTATALRPARRAQDFEECPVLTKIKKDDCGDVMCTVIFDQALFSAQDRFLRPLRDRWTGRDSEDLRNALDRSTTRAIQLCKRSLHLVAKPVFLEHWESSRIAHADRPDRRK